MAFPERVGRLSRGDSWDRKERGTSHGDQEEPSELCEQDQEGGVMGSVKCRRDTRYTKTLRSCWGACGGAGGDLCQAGVGD